MIGQALTSPVLITEATLEMFTRLGLMLMLTPVDTVEQPLCS
jgi:hypothetical protein